MFGSSEPILRIKWQRAKACDTHDWSGEQTQTPDDISVNFTGHRIKGENYIQIQNYATEKVTR